MSSSIDLASVYWAGITLECLEILQLLLEWLHAFHISSLPLETIISFPSPQQSDVVEVDFTLRLSTGLALESAVLRPISKGLLGANGREEKRIFWAIAYADNLATWKAEAGLKVKDSVSTK